jgi:hypothetical protein
MSWQTMSWVELMGICKKTRRLEKKGEECKKCAISGMNDGARIALSVI